jgi:hypothetical protein
MEHMSVRLSISISDKTVYRNLKEFVEEFLANSSRAWASSVRNSPETVMLYSMAHINLPVHYSYL